MKTANEGKELIKYSEGIHDGNLKLIGLQPKRCPADIWTEGWGRAMVYKGKFLKGKENEKLANSLITIHTIEEADKALDEDLVKFENIVNRKLKVKVSQNMFDALVSHTYNTGGSDTIFEMVNARKDEKTIKEWWVSHWITGQGNPKPLIGLINRRKAESNLAFS